MVSLKVSSCPTQELALTNCVFLSPADHAVYFDGDSSGYIELCGLIYMACPHAKVEAGCIALNSIQRRGTGVSNGDAVDAGVFKPGAAFVGLSECVFEVDYVVKTRARGSEPIDAPKLSAAILARFPRQFFSTGQTVAIEFCGENFLLRAGRLQGVKVDASEESVSRGMLVAQTSIVLQKAPGSPLVLKGGEGQRTNTLFKGDFSFEKMGIGGLDREFQDIFRRAFASRIFPAAVVRRMGVSHVKGMLLHGPPGTGKTLIARQIGKMLNGKEPKIVNGPEVLSKYVGQSEENIRNLFADAEAEQNERGDDSDLHIIIFDEIDSVCKARGTSRDGTGVGDTVVNQLLSKIDGVNALNNILVIGMTNRKDMIDEALLRPGRLEVQIEISLPDEAGRLQILNIHTTPMREANCLAKDVHLPTLATDTKNFSGAEIEGLVKSAASFAFQRHVTAESGGMKTGKLDDMELRMADFERALGEVKPAFGISSEDLSICVRGGMIEYGLAQRELMNSASELIKQVQRSEHTSLLSVLIEGESGSGKTAVAATLALQSDFPFVKLISPNSVIGVSEVGKAAMIAKVFDDAHKSPLSMVVIDDLERLLEYVRIGPRFSNLVLQTLLTCLKKQPKTGKLVILATSSSLAVLEQLEMLDAFNMSYHVPTLSKAEALTVLKALGAQGISAVEPCLNAVGKGMPIKKLVLVAEMSVDESRTLDPVRFATTMQSAGLLSAA
ncbi:hypothetical protein AB1Y20_018305 [Prymnesium parvum]|uniref:Vesicle-fusing ATPase n=1 Tax=Prymnesium parvum TaxID=97485 RepID=A0AB34JP80_PRYPA